MRTPARITCELNAPARPRSPVTSSRPTFVCCSWTVSSGSREASAPAGRLGLLQRLALVVEAVAEVLRVGLHSLLNRLLGLLRPVACGDLLEQLAVLGAHPLDQTLEELRSALDLDAVEEAVRRGVDLHGLILDGQRFALALVERGDEPLATSQRTLRVGVEVRAELGERLEVAIL